MSTLDELGEFSFIDRIAELTESGGDRVIGAIGDDAAIIDMDAPQKLIVTTDAAIEGRHFRLDWMTPFEAARRATVGAISDIAAMGATPFAALATMAFPPQTEQEVAIEFAEGVAETGGRYAAPLIGGDTVASFERIMIDLIVLGRAESPWLRSKAQAGDTLLLTGSIGDCAAALTLLQADKAHNSAEFSTLRNRLVAPVPRTAEAEVLAGADAVHAAIDISDGLAADAAHIADKSDVRLQIKVDRLPISPACYAVAEKIGADAPQLALSSGEEYELLLAVPPDGVRRISQVLRDRDLTPVTEIGRVTDGEGVAILDAAGQQIRLEASGWDHFGSPE